MIDLYCGDCLEIMKQIPDKSVGCIITSPPYNMCLRIHSGRYMSRWGWKGNRGSFSAKYDTYTDDLPMDKYFEFQDEFISQALRVSDLVFYNIQMITGNKVAPSETAQVWKAGRFKHNLGHWYEHCEPVKPDDDIIYKGGK